jgi:hypothetical protein
MVQLWTLNKLMKDRTHLVKGEANRYLDKFSAKHKLLKKVKTRQLSYFVHITRHNSLLKTTLEGSVEGRPERGRQRYLLGNNIRQWIGNSLYKRQTNLDAEIYLT